MKLPIPLLLYIVALGLFGLAGWTVYQMLPIWKVEVRNNAQAQGHKEGTAALDRGKAQGPPPSSWSYTKETAPWWAKLKDVKDLLVGKLPPPPPDPTQPTEVEVQKPVDLRPLETLIELVSLVSDGETGGRGGNSHVIVRFKPEANVQVPEWMIKETATPVAAAASARDTTPSRQGAPGGKPQSPPSGAKAPSVPQRPPSPLPVAANSGKEPLQKLWVQDGGDPRRSSTLWPMRGTDGREIGTIRLVRVHDDAQSAFFVRELPVVAGAAPTEPKEEELIKTSLGLSQDLVKELLIINGGRSPVREKPKATPSPTVGWDDVPETVRFGNKVNISRKDEQLFRDNSEDFISAVTFDTYQSRTGSTKGLIVKAVDARLASYGVAAGEVLLEVNNRKVSSKADAVAQVKGDYNRGVRTFTTKWLSNGQEVTRVYQAPPDR